MMKEMSAKNDKVVEKPKRNGFEIDREVIRWRKGEKRRGEGERERHAKSRSDKHYQAKLGGPGRKKELPATQLEDIVREAS